MKVKATHPMVKLMQQATPNYDIRLVKMTTDQYKMMVDIDIFNHEADYNDRTGMMQVIRVGYPANYYAMPRYVTTKDLNRVFRNSDHTIEGFTKALIEDIAI